MIRRRSALHGRVEVILLLGKLPPAARPTNAAIQVSRQDCLYPHRGLGPLWSPEEGKVGKGEWRVASGEWRVASGEWGVASGEWRVAGGEWRVASGEWRVASGEWRVASG